METSQELNKIKNSIYYEKKNDYFLCVFKSI
jgi:hypothetical protein